MCVSRHVTNNTTVSYELQCSWVADSIHAVPLQSLHRVPCRAQVERRNHGQPRAADLGCLHADLWAGAVQLQGLIG